MDHAHRSKATQTVMNIAKRSNTQHPSLDGVQMPVPAILPSAAHAHRMGLGMTYFPLAT